jgi:hypothetical protein
MTEMVLESVSVLQMSSRMTSPIDSPGAEGAQKRLGFHFRIFRSWASAQLKHRLSERQARRDENPADAPDSGAPA